MSEAARAEYPEFLADLAEKIAQFHVARGMSVDQAAEIGNEAVEYVREQWGGFEVYIPKGRSFKLSQRDQDIWNEWNGRNAVELCRKHGISEVRLRQILKIMRRQDVDRRQGNLF